jgi:hypothetical protein
VSFFAIASGLDLVGLLDEQYATDRDGSGRGALAVDHH